MAAHSLRIAGRSYPVLLPSPRDPRLHVSATILILYVLGETEFHFQLSIPQILAAILTCFAIEVAVTFWQKRALVWPASAMLTGSGIAFIMRAIGTRHGDWWSLHELWVYPAVAAVAMASKYLIRFRGRHVFNPSNLALLLAFVILGSGRVEPLQFWWGPLSPALVIVLLVIVTGALVVLTRVGILAVAVVFWATFAGALGVLALSGHAFTANWHLGPVANGYFWKVLVFSPEVFIFLSFMITDPRTAPETRRGRLIYSVAIALLGALLIAPAQTEYWAKVALLGALTIVCGSRPVLILTREALERHGRRSRVPRRVVAVAGVASFAALLLAAGSPARSFAKLSGSTLGKDIVVTIQPTTDVVAITPRTGSEIAAVAVAHDPSDHDVAAVDLQLQRAVGQAPPTVVATLRARDGSLRRRLDLALVHGRFAIVGSAQRVLVPVPQTSYASQPKGVGAFRKLRLVNVAPKLGLDFQQGAFRYSMSNDQQAMMGGGVCWLDFNNDGWMDLFVVNSYADVDLPEWDARGGTPQSALYRNVRGTFVDVSKDAHAAIRVKGNGCAAADLNGDGNTDLVVTTATGVKVLWNNGEGRFAVRALAAPYGWYTGAAVADVNGDGRPDVFVAGYTNMAGQIPGSMAGFPTNHEGVRDLLYLNEGGGRFKEAGIAAGLERSHFRHGLGAVFTDVNGDGRPDLYVANDEDPNDLYVNERGGPLGFHFVDEAKAFGVADANAGMGVAEADLNGDGRPDFFVTNSRGQPHTAYVSGETGYRNVTAVFAKALHRKATVGWGDAFVDLGNSGEPDLILANGAIPITSLKRDTEPLQLLQGLGGGRFTNASGIVGGAGMPRIIGRGLAPADFGNDGRLGIAINTVGGPLVLLEDTGPVGHWLEVSLKGFQAGAVLTATLPGGRRLVQELHAGSSYLSSGDPRAHFGLGETTRVAKLTIRWADGRVSQLGPLAADRIVTVAEPGR